MERLRGVNLNLLAAFAALVDERSVTRAAKRMGVTQSAMSSSLAQLRVLLDDPLFRRTAHGMEPTAKALELAGSVRPGLALLERALQPARFDPATAQRTFVIAASDHVELVLLPGLLRRIAREAPGVRVRVLPWGLHEVPTALRDGEAELAIGYYDVIPAHHRHRVAFEEPYVCIVRRGHPHVRARLGLSRWVQLEHVMVSQRGDAPGSVDVALAARGLTRTIGARVSHFLMVPVLVSRTDMVAAIDKRVAETFAGPLRLQLFAPPIPLPVGKLAQVWHEHVDGDPAHRWFRTLVDAECASLRG
jgi:DNA-binding transcriptional LysR family regulator